MSLRADSYLSLCLEQADMSPLHYRHGCIIVRGGKVIGQGYNTYRPGFDGGALKHGNMVGSLNGLSVAEFKQHLRQRKKPNSKSKPENQRSNRTFTPFEGPIGGHHLNAPLSLHSEMMAIQSALSLSSGAQSYQTSARSAKWLQKPCFKLSGASKRKARLRGLKAYLQAVCEESAAEGRTGNQSCGKFSLQESHFEAYPSQSSPGGSEVWQLGEDKKGERCGFIEEEEPRQTPNEGRGSEQLPQEGFL
jgi:deoxycytidylate deaminase